MENQQKKPEWLIEDYPPLNEQSQVEAIKTQIITYPKVVRNMDDPPIVNQNFSNISFMFFDAPKTLSSG